jgi:hypothetical protein
VLLDDIERAEGCYLYDSDGKRYVDLESGVWCTSIGHRHPRILKVIERLGGRPILYAQSHQNAPHGLRFSVLQPEDSKSAATDQGYYGARDLPDVIRTS